LADSGLQEAANEILLDLRQWMKQISALRERLDGELRRAPKPTQNEWLTAFVGLATTTLLAIAMACGGAIGAFIRGALRPASVGNRLAGITLGITFGFVTFLAVRGGKSVVVSELQNDFVYLNPFGLTLLGIIAGVLSEGTYMRIVDFWESRVNHHLKAEEAGATEESSTREPRSAEPRPS
jgi:hypothetical protein